MPIYEYSCPNCKGRFSKLVQGFNEPVGLACPRCGSTEVRRAVSRFAVLKSEDSRLEDLADSSLLAGLDENDPRSIARWAKKMGKQLGDEVGDDWDEMVDQMLEEELSGESQDGESAKEDDLGWA